jgi:hypothetical protein
MASELIGCRIDAARGHLDTRPDSAGNDARKIMDTELPLIAEKLGTRLPYLRGEKNDRRTGMEFFQQLIGDAAKAFEVRVGTQYEKHPTAQSEMEDAKKRLIAWGNPSSHGFETRKAEATKLIDSCEAALALFTCKDCKEPVWRADTGNSEIKQCECGALRWRYGKT